MNTQRKPQWKSDNWRGLQKAAVVYPLLATELNWHRERERMASEIKRLRSEVDLTTKRLHGARQQIQDMVTRLRAQPPPPVPEREPAPTSSVNEDTTRDEDTTMKDTTTEEKQLPQQLFTPEPTPEPEPAKKETLKQAMKRERREEVERATKENARNRAAWPTQQASWDKLRKESRDKAKDAAIKAWERERKEREERDRVEVEDDEREFKKAWSKAWERCRNNRVGSDEVARLKGLEQEEDRERRREWKEREEREREEFMEEKDEQWEEWWRTAGKKEAKEKSEMKAWSNRGWG